MYYWNIKYFAATIIGAVILYFVFLRTAECLPAWLLQLFAEELNIWQRRLLFLAVRCMNTVNKHNKRCRFFIVFVLEHRESAMSVVLSLEI